MTHVTIIVAIDRDGGIGRNGDLLYHISDDLRRFRRLTTGHTIIMGRKTYESFPKGPLPHRRNIIITRNADYHVDGAETAPSLRAALDMCNSEDKVFIIGGGEIYRQALPLASCLEITRIDAASEADTFFPVIDPNEWTVSTQEPAATDAATGLSYRFVTYLRNS
ncbi:MAG: dihydrofolate reductase [Bacteroides sp.]|nr:dihydrofolate reductase [Bacteroides sp.]